MSILKSGLVATLGLGLLAGPLEAKASHSLSKPAAVGPMVMAASPQAAVTKLGTKAVQIMIKDHQFLPAELTVSPGTTITWTNLDADPHSIIDQGVNHLYRSAALDTKDSYSHTFATAGTYHFFCGFHPNMTGLIIVK